MKFDVLRDSDYEAGLVGVDAPRPVEGAVLNREEDRWEIEVSSLEGLMQLIERAGSPVVILPTHEGCTDLPVINIIDAEFDDVADGDGDAIASAPN